MTARQTLLDGLARDIDRHARTWPDQVADSPILRPGLDGQPAKWTLAAVGYLGVVDSFLEPDPDFDAARSAP